MVNRLWYSILWNSIPCSIPYHAESPENYAEYKKPVSKGYILCGCIYRTFLKWQNFRNVEQTNDSGSQGQEWETGGCGYKRAIRGGILVGTLQYLDYGGG